MNYKQMLARLGQKPVEPKRTFAPKKDVKNVVKHEAITLEKITASIRSERFAVAHERQKRALSDVVNRLQGFNMRQLADTKAEYKRTLRPKLMGVEHSQNEQEIQDLELLEPKALIGIVCSHVEAQLNNTGCRFAATKIKSHEQTKLYFYNGSFWASSSFEVLETLFGRIKKANHMIQAPVSDLVNYFYNQYALKV